MGDEDGYSRARGQGGNMTGGNTGGGSYRGGSYARGGRGGRTGSNQYGSYARGRDSRGRYSGRGYSRAEGTEEMVMELRDLMNDAPNDEIRQRMKDLVSEIEMM